MGILYDIVSIMTRSTPPAHPAVRRLLKDLGANVRAARLRRGYAATLVAQRAGLTRPTLRAIETGSSTVSLGSVAKVLHVLGLHSDLALVARDDALGRRLQDAGLEEKARRRAPKRKKPATFGRPKRKSASTEEV